MPRKRTGSPREKLLDRLDELIDLYRLHEGDPLLPVCFDPLLDDVNAEIGQWWMPEPVHGIGAFRGQYASITVNRLLYEPGMSGFLRRTLFHEFGHIFLQHEGWYVVYRADWSKGDRFGKYLRTQAEKEAEIVAAYLAIRKLSLLLLHDKEPLYIGAVLDMPEHLVVLRQGILRNDGR